MLETFFLCAVISICVHVYLQVIAVEKADAEESLSAALPALEEARLALSDLDKNDVTEIRLATLIIMLFLASVLWVKH